MDKQKKQKGTRNKTVLSISITPELKIMLDMLACMDDSKLSPYICKILEQHCDMQAGKE